MTIRRSRHLYVLVPAIALAAIWMTGWDLFATAKLADAVHEYGVNDLRGTPASLLDRLLFIRSRLLKCRAGADRLLAMLSDPALKCEARLHVTIAMIGTLPAGEVDRLLAAMLLRGSAFHELAGEDHCLRQIADYLISPVPERPLSEDEFVKFLVSMHEMTCASAINMAPHLKKCGLRDMGLCPQLLRQREWRILGSWDTTDDLGLFSARKTLKELPIGRTFRSIELAESLRLLIRADPYFARDKQWLDYEEFGAIDGWHWVSTGKDEAGLTVVELRDRAGH